VSCCSALTLGLDTHYSNNVIEYLDASPVPPSLRLVAGRCPSEISRQSLVLMFVFVFPQCGETPNSRSCAVGGVHCIEKVDACIAYFSAYFGTPLSHRFAFNTLVCMLSFSKPSSQLGLRRAGAE